MATSALVSLIAYFFLFLLSGSWAVSVLPLTVSLLNFLCLADLKSGEAEHQLVEGQEWNPTDLKVKALAVGPAIVFLGSLVGSIFLSPSALAFLGRAREEIPASLLTSPLSQDEFTLWGHLRFVGASTFFAVLFAVGMFYFGPRIKRLAPTILLGLLLFLFVTAGFAASTDFRATLSQEPKYNSFGYDGLVNLKTFYLMSKKDFYHAYLEAASNDSRVIKVKGVRSGKFYAYAPSPFYFRLPVLFYVWRWFAGGNGLGIYYLAMMFAAGTLALAFSTARAMFGEKGALLAIAVMPALYVGMNWLNLLLLDWWAANALLIGIFFWLKKQFWPSAAAFLVACLFREVFFIFLALFIIFSFTLEKEARLEFLAAAGAFVLFYAWHYAMAAPLIGLKDSAADTVLSRISPRMFLSATQYQFFPYGFNIVPAFVFMGIAALSWLIAKRRDMMILTLLAFPYFAYASAYYWGQHLMPFIAFGAFALVLLVPVGRKTQQQAG